MATKYDIINGLKAIGIADKFTSIEIVEMVDGKDRKETVEYTLVSGLPLSLIQRAKEAIIKVAQDNGITVTSTNF